jgi:hypothetical protein
MNDEHVGACISERFEPAICFSGAAPADRSHRRLSPQIG